MRRLILSGFFALFAVALSSLPAAANTTIRLGADSVKFYYDQFLVEADGHVHVTTSDGYTVEGDAFSMDLKLNRFLVAGNVTMHFKGQTVSGAALSDFLNFNRIYFVPVTSEPDRWTFLDGDLTHPVKGRIMPGDVFSFPTVPSQPSIGATDAVIGAKSFARFGGAIAYLGGLPVPIGSYVVNFSSNRFFAQNSLTGANFDATVNFAGSFNSLSALHLRYDTVNHTYLAFEQHLVGEHEYAIFSVNPLSQSQRFFNVSLYDQLGSRFQVQTFSQFYVDQGVFLNAPPLAATHTTFVYLTQAMPHSYLQLTSNFTNYNILGPGSFNANNHAGPGNLSHPSQMQLTWTSFQNRVGKLPLYEQIYGGYGFNHDTVGQNEPFLPYSKVNPCGNLAGSCNPCGTAAATWGLQCFGDTTYTTIYNTVAGFSIFVPSIKIGDHDDPYKTYYLNAVFNKQRQWNSLPHHIDNTITTFSLSRQFARQINSYASYQVANTGDYYIEGGYQPCTPSPTCPDSLTSFRGVSTLRTFSFGTNYVPNPDFNASVLYRHHVDFPIPVPGLFPPPVTNVLGQEIINNYVGQPPNDLTGDVRFRVLPHMMLDVQRTYYFGFANQTWSPQFIVQVLPQ